MSRLPSLSRSTLARLRAEFSQLVGCKSFARKVCESIAATNLAFALDGRLEPSTSASVQLQAYRVNVRDTVRELGMSSQHAEFACEAYDRLCDSRKAFNVLTLAYAQADAPKRASKLQAYATFRPTAHDTAGLNCEDKQDWLVVPCNRNRDSDCLSESNFAAALARLNGESETCEVCRFGHWACGWFEIILIHPSRASEGESIAEDLDGYPVLDENDFSEREEDAARETWEACYSVPERIAYIRKHRTQFEFRDLGDMLGCVRGKYFAGYASELLS